MTLAPNKAAEEADAFHNLVQGELGDASLPGSKTGGGTTATSDGFVLAETTTSVEKPTRTPFDRDDEAGRSSIDGKLWKGAGGAAFAIDSDSVSGKDAIQEASRARAERIRQRDETERESRQKARQLAAQEWEKMHQSWEKVCQEKRQEARKRQEALETEREALLRTMVENADNDKPVWHCVRALLESGGSGSVAGRPLTAATVSMGKTGGNASAEEEGLYRTSRARMREVIYAKADEADGALH